MGCPASMDTSTTQPLYLSLREHDRTGDRGAARTRRTGRQLCEILSSIYAREAALRKSLQYDCLNKTQMITPVVAMTMWIEEMS